MLPSQSRASRSSLLVLFALSLASVTTAQDGPTDPEELVEDDDHLGYDPADTPAGADPVILRTGDFTEESTDLSVASRGLDLEFRRHYRSGSRMETALGKKWDFNWNQYIVIQVGEYAPFTPPWDGPVGPNGEVEVEPQFVGGYSEPPDSEGTAILGGDEDNYVYVAEGIYYANGQLRLDAFWSSGQGPIGGEPMSIDGSFAKLRSVGVAPPPYNENMPHPERFELRQPDGTLYTFALADYADLHAKGIVYRLTCVEDRQGNRIELFYKKFAKHIYYGPGFTGPWKYYRLAKVVGPLGRSLTFELKGSLYGDDEILSVSDSSSYPADAANCAPDGTGRKVTFTRDEDHNLIEVRSPVVTGTPTGNDFCDGKITQYTYDDESRLLTIAAGQEVVDAGAGEPVPYLTNVYAAGQVTTQVFGYPEGSEPSGEPDAGGTYRFFYEDSVEEWEEPLGQFSWTSERRTLMVDPNGNTTLIVYDDEGRARLTYRFTGRLDPLDVDGPLDELVNVSKDSPSFFDALAAPAEPKLRPWDPNCFLTRREFNEDGLVTRLKGPKSDIEYRYDEGPDPFQHGNLVLEIRHPVPDSGEPAIVTGYAYDTLFNQPRLIIDPRAKAVAQDGWTPPNGAPSSIERYVTEYTFDYEEGCCLAAFDDTLEAWEIEQEHSSTMQLLTTEISPALDVYFNCGHRGDCNDDQNYQTLGNVVRKKQVVSEPVDITASTLAFSERDVITTYVYNSFSNLIEVTDPEGNVTQAAYHSEADPDGDGVATVPPAASSLVLDTTTGAAGGGFLKSVTDVGTSITESFLYDELGRLVEHTDGRGYVWTTEYNALDQVVRTVDPRGYEELTFYDASNNLVEQHVTNKVPELDGSLRPTGNEVTGASGSYIVSRFEYDILNQLIESDVQESATERIVTRHRYDRAGNRVAILTPNSLTSPYNIVTHILDERGLIWKQTRGDMVRDGGSALFLDPNAHDDLASDPAFDAIDTLPNNGNAATETFSYNGEGQIVSKVDAAGKSTTYTYDAFNRLGDTTDAAGTLYRMSYDPASQLVQRTVLGDGSSANVLEEATTKYDELGRKYEQNALLQPIGSSLPTPDGPLTPGDGWVTSRTKFDLRGLAILEVDDNGARMQYTYDSLGRPVEERVLPYGDHTITKYNAAGQPIRTRLVEYDAAGVPIPETNHWSYYDELGRLVAEVDELGNTTRYAYDSRGNLVFESDAQSTATIGSGELPYPEGHDGSIAQIIPINGHGNTTVHEYDDANRRTSTTQHLRTNGNGAGTVIGSIETTVTYDKNGSILSQRDGEGNVTQYAYDALDRPTVTTYQDGTTEVVNEYDPRGMRKVWTDQNGTTVTCTFDPVGRIATKSIDYSGSDPSVVTTTTSESFTYDGIGRLLSASDDDTTVARKYDSVGRMIEETVTGPSGVPRTVQRELDGIGLTRKLVYPQTSGRVVQYGYDAANRLESVWDASMVVADYTYEGFGRVATRHYPANDTGTTFTYDEVRRVASTTHATAFSTLPQTFDERQYGYDRVWNKTLRTDEIDDLEHELSYDSIYRLTESVLSQASVPVRDIAYEYDTAGNRVSVTTNGVEEDYAPTAVPDAEVNQYTTTPWDVREYDDNGNLLEADAAGAETSYGYDYRNQLVSLTRPDGLTASYSYDVLGRRVRKAVTPPGGVTEATDYVHAEGRVIEEVTATGSRTFVYGAGVDEILTMRSALTDYFVHADELGSTVAVTDASGVVEEFLYGDFGEILDDATLAPLSLTGSVASTGLPYLYTGRRLDAESGLFHLRARYLEPRAGRFTTRDPIGIWGDSANLGNGYTYTANSPWTWTDPLGTERLWGTPEHVFGCVVFGDPAASLPPWASPVAWVSAWSIQLLPKVAVPGLAVAIGCMTGFVSGPTLGALAFLARLGVPMERHVPAAGTDGAYESRLGSIVGVHRDGTRSQATVDRYDLGGRSWWDKLGDAAWSAAGAAGAGAQGFASSVSFGLSDYVLGSPENPSGWHKAGSAVGTVLGGRKVIAGAKWAWRGAKGIGRGAKWAWGAVFGKGAASGVSRPTVANSKLRNLVDDLYKGANSKSPIGTGSTADAIRHELATGQAVGGRFHTQKGQQYARALEKWLSKNPGASASDRGAAQSILNDLRSALGGN